METIKRSEQIEKLVSDLLDGKQHLSHSSFSAFLKSPAHFIDYKFGERKQKKEFDDGQLVDTILTENELFESKYIIMDRNTTLPFPDKNYQNKANREARDAFILENEGKGKKVVQDTDVAKAKEIVKSIKNCVPAWNILQVCDSFQERLEFNYQGFKWLGFKDASSEELTVDVKTAKTASKRGFKRSIWEYGYHRQGFIYNVGDGWIDKPYFLIAVEKEKPYAVGVHHLSKSMLETAQTQIERGLKDLRKCLIDPNLFKKSYDFHASHTHGVFDVVR